MTAITGASGTGKSTIAKLLVGLLTVNSGEILLNGIPLSHLGPTQARRMFGCVMQDDALFHGSLAENIALFQEGAQQQQIEHSAQAACIHDDISRMPMGYRTSVGDMGSTLSGGQRQRIMLARALYQQPQALLLDEATSHLDAETEQSINAHLRQMSLTVIQIAHRFETIDAADCLLRVHPDGSRTIAGFGAAESEWLGAPLTPRSEADNSLRRLAARPALLSAEAVQLARPMLRFAMSVIDPNDIAGAQHEVQRLVGRCILRLQQCEQLMKSMLAFQKLSGTPETLPKSLNNRRTEIGGKTMGAVVGCLTTECMLKEGGEVPDGSICQGNPMRPCERIYARW
ncbi:hypothetical protein G6F31_014157 [Rhizopus arrhizus]|nr:hypothetical protein G6F31_014157 [Rhizopus arrhizus]